MNDYERLESIPIISEPITTCLIDGSITYNTDLVSKAEYAFTLPTPAGESPPFYLIRHREVPFWYIHFHGIDFLSADKNVDVGFTQTWYVLHMLGVEKILSGAAVGSLSEGMKPRDVVIISDFIDLSSQRPRSILLEIWNKSPYLGGEFVPPVCEELSTIMHQIFKQYPNGKTHNNCTLAQFEGHRFETPAEIKMAQKISANVVAHHQASEAIYSRELGIHFCAIAYVSNIAAGLKKNWGKSFVTDEEAKTDYEELTNMMLDGIVSITESKMSCKSCLQNEDYKLVENYSTLKNVFR